MITAERRANQVETAIAVKKIRVYMLDLLPTVPYYTGYLCAALARLDKLQVDVGCTNYYLDHGFFSRAKIRLDGGLIDAVAGFPSLPTIGRRALKAAEYLSNLTALLARFKMNPPDVLHVQFVPLLATGLPVEMWFLKSVKRMGIKIVYTVHNVLPQDNGEKYRHVYQECYQLADHLICHEEEARRRLVNEFGIADRDISTIAHGPLLEPPANADAASVRRRLGIEADQGMVLWQGIIKPYKGISYLLKSWQQVRAAGTNAKLVIAGKGDDQIVNEIQQEIRDLKLEDSVIFDGRFLSVTEVADYYSAADVITYPYRNITTSGALMTGICYGKAIVATSQPGFAKTLRDESNALIVDYGDVNGLAQRLCTLLRDPAMRGRLGSEARKTFLNGPQWEGIAAETHRCYTTLCDSIMGGMESN